MAEGYVEFEFDLPAALLVRLIEVFAGVEPATLGPDQLNAIPDAQGVYQLFLDGELVYIGKTDAEAGLRKRLTRHRNKIVDREALDPMRVSFKAVRLFVFTAIDLETQLIDHYGGVKSVPWNGSGFGANDPGRNRDKTGFKEGHFDLTYPINIDRSLDLDLSSCELASDALREIKAHLPFLFRFQMKAPKSRKPHPDLLCPISIETTDEMTVRAALEAIVSQLPSGWQATKLPSHLILYKERVKYKFGEVVARS